MLEIFLVMAMVTSLIILYHYLPNRKIFLYFCLSLIVVFAIAGVITRSQQPQPTMNQKERQELMKQQNIFIDWYTEYQKDIDKLDRNWNLYHTAIDNFNDNSIDTETLLERLTNLENEVKIEQVHLYALKAPSELGEECTTSIKILIKKTQLYVDSQLQTIMKSKSLIESETFLNSDNQTQEHMLQEIIIREAPIGLYTANELTEILKYFTLPEEETAN